MWESIGKHDPNNQAEIRTQRMKVHGGWLVRCTYTKHPNNAHDQPDISLALTFVPDAAHEWQKPS